MKEIKFRAWDKTSSHMFQWENILINKELLQSFFGNEAFMCNPPKYFWERMQYTGLKDKSGKEIYEGDIIEINTLILPERYNRSFGTDVDTDIRKVSWIDDGGGFGWEDNPTGATLCAFNSKYLTIIGNIYENPELLKQTEAK